MRPQTLPSGKVAISCSNYPNCRSSYYLPSGATISSRGDQCPRCGSGYYKADFNFASGTVPPYLLGGYRGCIKCDPDLSEIIPRPRIAASSALPQAQFRGNQSGNASQRQPRNGSKKRKSDNFDDSQSKRGSGQSQSRSPLTETNAKCKCNTDAASRITQKEGPNKGRQFYTCGNDRKCNYFEWADQFTPQPNTSHDFSQPRFV